MGSCGSCVFQAGYKIYADTRVGRCFHTCYINRYIKNAGENAFHSKMTLFRYNSLRIIPVPALSSNYTYLVIDLDNRNFVMIDVGHMSKHLIFSVQPDAILCTHKHWDHCHGNRELRRIYPDVPIYGGEKEHVPDATVKVADGEVIKFGRLSFTAVWTPGHTKGHMCFLLDGSEFNCPPNLFTGDHLMLGACGANFEGNVKVMTQSLNKLLKFPDRTLIWPGHEVGLGALLLAASLEEDNLAVRKKLVWVILRRIHGYGTCPSTLGEERLFNPFLRTKDESLLKHLGLLTDSWDEEKEVDRDDMAAACFSEILRRFRDKSQEAKAKKARIIDDLYKDKQLASFSGR